MHKYKKMYALLLAFTTLLCHMQAAGNCQQIAPGSQQDFAKIKFSKVLELEPLTPGFAVLEGPLWVGDALWLSHIGMPSDDKPNPADILIYREGKISTLKKAYGANGLTYDNKGRVVAARHLDGTITRVDDGKILAATYNKQRFNSPNDLVIASSGHIYFSDPDWQNPKPTQKKQRMYHVSTTGEVTGFGDIIEKPNGVMLTKDEKNLYAGGVNGLFKYALNSDGSVVDKPRAVAAKHLPEGIDGMSRDCAGNIYVTAAGQLHVLEENSDKILASYPIPNATNVAFGGTDGTTIFVTALGKKPSLWQAKGSLRGLPY